MQDVIRDKDRKVLEYIGDYFDRHGYAPAIRDICRDVQIKSTATAHASLSRLANAGYLRISPNLKRTIELVLRPAVRNVPLLGTIAAGQPILATENRENVYPLPAEMFGYGGELFMLKVKGDSMIEAGIFDGDSIVVRQQETADNGQMVAALIEDSATVKYYFKEDGRFRLQPANETMQPLYFDEVKILGLVVGLMRKI